MERLRGQDPDNYEIHMRLAEYHKKKGELRAAEGWPGRPQRQVALDLNAVPPAGIAGVSATDKAVRRDGVVCYGALGVGGTKMRIHKAAIAALFADNQRVLDAEEIYALGCELESSGI